MQTPRFSARGGSYPARLGQPWQVAPSVSLLRAQVGAERLRWHPGMSGTDGLRWLWVQEQLAPWGAGAAGAEHPPLPACPPSAG